MITTRSQLRPLQGKPSAPKPKPFPVATGKPVARKSRQSRFDDEEPGLEFDLLGFPRLRGF